MIGRVNIGGGNGADLTVTAPAGSTVTVSKDGKTKTKTAGEDGVAVFKGLSTGVWTLYITDGTQTAQKPVTITADYAASISFFAATIHVTYPAGYTCTATDGVTTLTAPDTGGVWDCVVTNAGTWTLTAAGGGWPFQVDITANGQQADADLTAYWLYKDGDACAFRTGGFGARGLKFTSQYYKAIAPVIAENSDSMTVTQTTASTYASGIVEVLTDIDLTDLSALHIDFGSTGTSYMLKLVVMPRDTAYITNAVASADMAACSGSGKSLTVDRKEVSLDVSSMTGSYDIAVALYCPWNTSITCTMNLFRLYLD